MVKVTIERNGEVSEFEGDAVFGGVIADSRDATKVNVFLVGRICEQDTPKIMADVMCGLAKRTRESGDVIDQLEALAEFANKVSEITSGEMRENVDTIKELLEEVLEKISEEA